jgi:hypothetical protein
MAPSDAGTATAGSGGSGLARWLPVVGWLREYDRGSPCSAGCAPSRLALTGYAIFGSSRELVADPSASVVALSASAVGAVAVAKAGPNAAASQLSGDQRSGPGS